VSPGGTQHTLTADAVRALPQPSVAPGSSRATIARAFAVQNARALGLTGDLGPARAVAGVGGGSVVRFDQTVGGVPVMGGQVVVDVGASGIVRGALSETLPGAAPATTPSIPAATAVGTARTVTARALGGDDRGLVVAPPALTVFDPQILGAPGMPGARLAWRTEVTSSLRPDVRQLVVVDAATGMLLLSADLIVEGKSRTVCDAQNVLGAGVPCASPVRSEGEAATGQQDVDLAYDYAGRTYDFYSSVLGRDSIDGAGMTIVSTVRYCENGSPCPLDNAFWNGTQMVYGEGFASADDVVAHELTHGVTEKTSGLFYFYESGAINESLSDIFGEFVDLTDGVGTDTAGTRWQVGEDLPAAVGVIRNMKTPGVFGDPDATDSPNFSSGTGTFGPVDSGAVHQNSGVGNKFAYLLTDGDTFNGVTVTGLGVTAAARIIYGAAQRLTSASDYRGFAAALKLSCAALAGTNGVPANACTSVDAAISATRMAATPSVLGNGRDPQRCSFRAGATASVTWVDDFEDAASTRWSRGAVGTWFYPEESNPLSSAGLPPRYATSGVRNLWAYDRPSTTNASIVQIEDPIAVVDGTYVRFNHAFAFDQQSTTYYDGGVLEYATAQPTPPAGTDVTWTPAGSLFVNNGYTGSVSAYTGTTNVLKGSRAFVGTSKGYVTSQLDLSSLAGQTVWLRFRLGADSSIDSYGWFIDDVETGVCSDTTKPKLTMGTLTAVSYRTPVVTATATDNVDVAGFVVRKRYAGPTGAFSAWSAPAFRAGTSLRWIEPFVAGRTTCLSVQAKDSSGNLSAAQTRCTTMPLDDRGLTRSATGWTSTTSSTAYLKTLSTSKKAASYLFTKNASGTSLVLVVRKGAGAGTVSVWVGAKRVRLLALAAPSASTLYLPITTGAFSNATVKIKVESAGTAGVAIDGLAIRRA
jgi:Zn-dependent metalloprotease